MVTVGPGAHVDNVDFGNRNVSDTTPPAVTVDPVLTNDPTPPLTGTVDDPAAQVEVTVAGRTYAAVNLGDGSWTLPDDAVSPPLSDGMHDVTATARDLAGNAATDETSAELTVDTLPPAVTVDTLITNDATPALSGTVDDPSATVAVSVAGSSYTATNLGNGVWILPRGTLTDALDDGVYEIRARAADVAGNVAVDATTGELTVDTAPPVVTIHSLSTSDATPALTGTVDDVLATVTVRLAGQTYTAANLGDGSWILPDGAIAAALPAGLHDVSVTAADPAGNAGADGSEEELAIGPAPYRNLRNPFDVDGDGRVSPQDALRLINELNFAGTRWLVLPPAWPGPPPYLDPTGDNLLSPADVLAVVNVLNGLPAGEGEESACPAPLSPASAACSERDVSLVMPVLSQDGAFADSFRNAPSHPSTRRRAWHNSLRVVRPFGQIGQEIGMDALQPHVVVRDALRGDHAGGQQSIDGSAHKHEGTRHQHPRKGIATVNGTDAQDEHRHARQHEQPADEHRPVTLGEPLVAQADIDGRTLAQDQRQDDIDPNADQDGQIDRRVMPVQASLQPAIRRLIALDATGGQLRALPHDEDAPFAPQP